MAKQTIDITTQYPGWTGDPNPTAFTKVNANFDELYALTGSIGTIVEDVEQLKTEIEEKVDTALQDVDEKVAQAEQQLDQAIAQIPAQVDTAIAGRIPGKNVLINGNFDFAQRNSSGTINSAAVYTADRWLCSSAGAATSNWGIGAFASGEVYGARRFLGFNIVAGAVSSWIGQRVEGVQALAGEKATVSFWMRSGVAGKKVGVLLQQNFGTGGAPGVNIIGPVITLTATFTKYTVTVDVPAISGKAYGANANLLLAFFLSDNQSLWGNELLGQTGLFEIGQVQLERGPSATEFEVRQLATEFGLCQRYYQKSYNADVYPGSAAAGGLWELDIGAANTGRIGGSVTFRTSMRADPAVTCYDVVGAAGKVFRGANGATGQIYNPGQNGVHIFAAPGAAANEIAFHWTADAEIF